MASVHIARFADMEFMFNIASGVGRGRANQSLDVMLVQYLLSLASDESVQSLAGGGSITSLSTLTPPEYKYNTIKADGIYGTQTQTYIDYYQTYRNAHSQRSDANSINIDVKVATDGAIDPWKFPAVLKFNYAGSTVPLDRSSTLVALCYDAAKSSEMSREIFSTMPDRLKRVLLAH